MVGNLETTAGISVDGSLRMTLESYSLGATCCPGCLGWCHRRLRGYST